MVNHVTAIRLIAKHLRYLSMDRQPSGHAVFTNVYNSIPSAVFSTFKNFPFVESFGFGPVIILLNDSIEASNPSFITNFV